MNKKKSGVAAPNTNGYTTDNGGNYDKCFCTCFSTRIDIWMNQILLRVLTPLGVKGRDTRYSVEEVIE